MTTMKSDGWWPKVQQRIVWAVALAQTVFLSLLAFGVLSQGTFGVASPWLQA